MKYQAIPSTRTEVSGVTLGTRSYGGENWGPADERQSEAAIKAAIDNGINSIDTAPDCSWALSEKEVQLLSGLKP